MLLSPELRQAALASADRVADTATADGLTLTGEELTLTEETDDDWSLWEADWNDSSHQEGLVAAVPALREGQGLNKSYVVVLMEPFSNTRAPLVRLLGVGHRLHDGDEEPELTAVETYSPARPPVRVCDRLSPEQVLQLITNYHTGKIARALAEDYGISLSSVKRLLRQHRGRLKDLST